MAILKIFERKIQLLEDIRNLVDYVPAKFECCAPKEVGFFRVTGFFKKHYSQFSPHGCQFDDTDFKLGELDSKSFKILHEKYMKFGEVLSKGELFERYLEILHF